jgi:predicted dehydrogenase
MTEDRPIKVGVIGAGIAARTGHLPSLRALAQFELCGAVDPDSRQREAAQAACPGLVTFEDIDLLYAAVPVDAVVIATPPATHADLVRGALQRGIHVLVEKPMARTVDECHGLIGLAQERGVTLSVGHEKRFHPTMAKARSVIAQGDLGTVFHCGVHWGTNVKLDPDHLVPPDYRRGYEWRWSDPSVEGGLMQDHLPHYVDLLRWWSGQEPLRVFACIRNVARDLLGWSPERSCWDDFVLVVMEFSGGMLMRFDTSVVGRSLSPILSLGAGVGEWTEYGYVLGTEGQLVFDVLPWDSSENGRLAIWQRDRAVAAGQGWTYLEQPEPARRSGSPSGASAAMFRMQAEGWARTLRGGDSEIALGKDGIIAVAAVEAAYRSVASGRSETVSL